MVSLAQLYKSCVLTITRQVQCFMSGVSKFGLPQRVRSDHGDENIDVWLYMVIAHNGELLHVIILPLSQ